MNQSSSPESFKNLQDKWYSLIKEDGFEDIEDFSLPDRPLKEWHSLESQKSFSIREQCQKEYYKKAYEFTNHTYFYSACCCILKYRTKKPKLDYFQVAEVWLMHAEDLTERVIASHMNVSKTCIHMIIVQLREWMKLL